MNVLTENLQFVDPKIFELNIRIQIYYIATSGNNIHINIQFILIKVYHMYVAEYYYEVQESDQ
jgi:hypothetical protein